MFPPALNCTFANVQQKAVARKKNGTSRLSAATARARVSTAATALTW